jgi:hypothetical protein
MDKSIGKKDTIYIGQKDMGEDWVSQSKPKTLPRDITTQRWWLITSSNLLAIT